MPSPSTKPIYSSCGRFIARNSSRGLADFLVALHLLDADIEQPDGRPLQVEQHARHGAAHDRQRHQMMRIAADGGAEIEHHRTRRAWSARSRRAPGGRCPVSMRRQNRAMATSAPVLPAEITTSASPFFTASIASHIEEVLRPRRSAWLGLSCMLTVTSVWTTREAAFSAGCRSSSGAIWALSPNSRNSVSGCRARDDRGSGNDDGCADIPPMASSAIRTF